MNFVVICFYLLKMARNRVSSSDIGVQYRLETGRKAVDLNGPYGYDDLIYYAKWLEEKLIEEFNTQNAKHESKIKNRD
jgi:hypothetical protein